MSNLLFIYGTLLQSDNQFAQYLRQNSVFYSEGKFRGRLYDIGNYPGAIADLNSDNYVYGNIVRLNDQKAVLKNIDPYEGVGVAQPKPNLYIRKLIVAETPVGETACWIYLYNLPVTGLHQITSGDYLDYKNKKSP